MGSSKPRSRALVAGCLVAVAGALAFGVWQGGLSQAADAKVAAVTEQAAKYERAAQAVGDQDVSSSDEVASQLEAEQKAGDAGAAYLNGQGDYETVAKSLANHDDLLKAPHFTKTKAHTWSFYRSSSVEDGVYPCAWICRDESGTALGFITATYDGKAFTVTGTGRTFAGKAFGQDAN